MGKHYGQLDFDERIELSRHHDAGKASSEIARIMGRHPSTIGRELRRNTALFSVLPKAARRSITFDNGSEFAQHQKLEGGLGLLTFFCDPYPPWQRGSIENANGILRRDLPRNTEFSDYTEQDIQDIVWANNTTPRKRLGYLTPAEAFLIQLRSCT